MSDQLKSDICNYLESTFEFGGLPCWEIAEEICDIMEPITIGDIQDVLMNYYGDDGEDSYDTIYDIAAEIERMISEDMDI